MKKDNLSKAERKRVYNARKLRRKPSKKQWEA